MGCTFYNKGHLDIINSMDTYFYQKETDCILFSEDGHEFPIHKVTLTLGYARTALHMDGTLSTEFHVRNV